MNFDSKLVLDYINGNDIDDYDIEDLENNSDFMIKVINYTNDKKMYYFCSDDVKNNYKFVKYIVERFKDDKDFIVSVANFFLENHKFEEENYDCKELNIIMSDIIGYTDVPELLMFTIFKKVFYTESMAKLFFCVKNSEKLQSIDDFGVGFFIIEDLFKSRPIILNFFAKEIIDDIFIRDTKFNFEQLIHNNAKNFKDIKDQGINNFLIKYIEQYDSNLSWYIKCNIELLDDIKSSLNNVEKNWDNYVKINNSKKVEIFEQEIFTFFDENIEYTPTFTVTELIEYIIREFNLEEIFMCNENYCEFRNSEFYISSNYDNKQIINKNSFIDLKYYKFAIDLLNKIFKKNIIEDTYEFQNVEEIREQKARILNLDFEK